MRWVEHGRTNVSRTKVGVHQRQADRLSTAGIAAVAACSRSTRGTVVKMVVEVIIVLACFAHVNCLSDMIAHAVHVREYSCAYTSAHITR